MMMRVRSPAAAAAPSMPAVLLLACLHAAVCTYVRTLIVSCNSNKNCSSLPVCSLPEYEVPSATAQLQGTRRVYRLLKARDVKPTLKGTEVHILWPDNGVWYMAEVLQVRRDQHSSCLSLPRPAAVCDGVSLCPPMQYS
jgi:hypothetical protein